MSEPATEYVALGIPASLKAELEAAAAAASRSLSGEIRHRLAAVELREIYADLIAREHQATTFYFTLARVDDALRRTHEAGMTPDQVRDLIDLIREDIAGGAPTTWRLRRELLRGAK